MGFLKKVDKGISKAEKRYGKLKKDTEGIRRVGGKIFDFIIPPPKKKGAKAGKTVKIGDCTCTCPQKRKRR